MVLAANSLYFEKALKNPLVEGSSRVFHFNEGSVHAHWRVFQFMYFGKYTDEPRRAARQAWIIPQYQPTLLIYGSFGQRADLICPPNNRRWSVAETLTGLHPRGLLSHDRIEGLRHAEIFELYFRDAFIDCIQEVYATTSKDDYRTRDAVVRAAREHARKLLTRQRFQDLI